MAMVGRNAAVAEIGSNHHPLTGVFAFAAWLGVHATLLTTGRAKIEAFLVGFGITLAPLHVSGVLDRPSVDWGADKH